MLSRGRRYFADQRVYFPVVDRETTVMIFPKYVRIKKDLYHQDEGGIHHDTNFCLWNLATNTECRIFKSERWDCRVLYEYERYVYMSLLSHKYGEPDLALSLDNGWYTLQKVLDLLEANG